MAGSRFLGTLTADVASGATSIQTSAPPVYGDNLVFEPGNSSNVDIGGQGGPRVASVSGSAAPYTVSFVPTTTNPWNGAADGALGTPGKAHVTGSAVKATIGTDGTHAAMSAHMGAAVPLRTIYQKLAGDASAQRNIISGSVRTKLPISQGAAIASAQKYVARVRHKANSYVDEPFFEYFHGQMISSGGVGFNLQRGFLNSDRVVNSVAVSGTTMTLTMETTRGYRTGDVVTVRNNGADYASGAITIASDTTATLTVANGTAAPGGTVVCRNPFYRIERRAALVTGIAGVAQDQSAAGPDQNDLVRNGNGLSVHAGGWRGLCGRLHAYRSERFRLPHRSRCGLPPRSRALLHSGGISRLRHRGHHPA